MSINFSRLEVAKPGLGYGGIGAAAHIETPYPADDGLHLLHLDTGKSRLIVSYKDIRKFASPPPELAGPFMWFHHVQFNQDDSRIFFVARTKKRSAKKPATATMTVNQDGSELRQLLPYDWAATHYDWLNPKQLVVTAMYEKTMRSHVLVNDDDQAERRAIAKGTLLSNGHPAFSEDGRWLLTDEYPDAQGVHLMFLVKMKTDAMKVLHRIQTPAHFRKGPRCIHARWNKAGNRIVFDSTQSGTRQVYVMNLEDETE